MALMRLTCGLLLATCISGNTLAASRGIANPALFFNRAAAAPAPVIDYSAPIASYSFDFGGYDCSGNNYHLTTNGVVVLSPGIVTNAVMFDETGGYMSITPSPISMSATQSATISVWFKRHDPNPMDNSPPYLLALYDPNCAENPTIWWQLRLSEEQTGESEWDQIYAEWTNSIHVSTAAAATNNVPTNQWAHVAVTWNCTNSTARVWLNGVPGEESEIDEPVEDALALFVGNVCAGQPSSVEIDNLLLYDRVLSDDTIVHLSQNPEAGVINCSGAGCGYVAGTAVFGGNNEYLRSADLLTNVADSVTVTVSFWINRGANDARHDVVHVTESGVTRFRVSLNSTNQVAVEARTTDNSTVINGETTSTLTADGQWHHVLVAVNPTNPGTTNDCIVWIDGVNANYVRRSGTSGDIGLEGNLFTVGGNGNTPPGNDLVGALAEVWFDTSYVDDPTKFASAKFASGSCPISLGEDGSLPAGSQPLVYLKGAGNDFGINSGSGLNLERSGTLYETTPP